MQLNLRPSIALLTVITIVFVSTASAKPGNGKGGGGGGNEEPPPTTSCAEKPSAFPSFAFTKLNTEGGRIKTTTSIDFYLSNADGDCAVLVHTADVNVDQVELSYRQIGDSGLIAWYQGRDEFQSTRSDAYEHQVIRILRFQTSNKEIVSVDPVDTVFNSGDPYIYIESMDLAPDGETIVFIHSDSVVYGTYLQTIREISLSSCSASCSESVTYTPSNVERLYSVSYGAFDNRIYYSGAFKSDSGDPRASQGFISFIEYSGAAWSSSRLLTVEGNGFYSNDFSGSWTMVHLDAALVDLGGGNFTEAVAYRYIDILAGDSRNVHVIDTQNCSVNGTGDCLGTGESFLIATIDDGEFPNVGATSLLFSSYSSNELYRFDFLSGNVALVGTGNESDTGAD